MSLERPIAPDPYELLPALPGFDLRSDDIVHMEPLKDDQVAALGNTSPHLAWSGAPDGTKSYVVSCFDPDAPTPSGFWHWTLVDVPASVTELAAGAASVDLPGSSFHVRNDASEKAFMGAAPPAGDRAHRYYFVVHAVKVESLGLNDEASATAVAFNLAFKAIARAVIVGTHRATS